MKDKLILKKNKINYDDGKSDCNGCVLDGFDNCGTDATCDFICEKGYNFKIVEEPQEIQTEYQWVKGRYELLHKTSEADFKGLRDEYKKHGEWLEENKPTKWVTCTRENTRVGDEVRTKDFRLRTVEHIFSTKSCGTLFDCVVTCQLGSYPSQLKDYEINIYGKETE